MEERKVSDGIFITDFRQNNPSQNLNHPEIIEAQIIEIKNNLNQLIYSNLELKKMAIEEPEEQIWLSSIQENLKVIEKKEKILKDLIKIKENNIDVE